MVPAISTKDYAVGDLIFSEMPFVKVLNNDVKSKYCDNCLCQSSRTVTLKKCTACMNMHYCSKSCQKEDWKGGHKYECELYKHHYNSSLGKYHNTRLFLRLLFLLKNKKELASRKINLQYDESVKISFNDLVKMTTSNLGMKQEFVATLKIFDCYDIEDFDCVPVFEYFRQHFHNLVYVFSEYGQVASGNYMSPSVFGHSCFPNATRTFNGCRLDIRAIKEIKKGEPITVSITRVDKSRKKRHSYLEYNYLIDCKCERCTSNFDEEFDYANKERLELEMSKAEHTDQWDKAFQIGKKLIPLYKHLGGYDTSVSWHLMRMAELYEKIQILKLGTVVGDVLEDTVKHVKVTHGVDHRFYKKYLQLLEESKRETKK